MREYKIEARASVPYAMYIKANSCADARRIAERKAESYQRTDMECAKETDPNTDYDSWSMRVDDYGLQIESVIQSAVDLLFLIMMIDNPLPDQVMQEKQRDSENELFKEYAYKEAKELCQEHSVVPEYISSFQEWYHDYLSDPKNQDPNDMIDKRHLIDDWWEEQGKILSKLNVVDGHTILPHIKLILYRRKINEH